MKSPQKLVLLAITVLAFAPLMFSSASNIYITQNGSPSGNCTSNVQNLAWFNNPANWGNGNAQIGPGTTVLLCGTFSGASNSYILSTRGDGASGNPVLVQFDTGASLSAGYFGSNGAINIQNNYITVDGGSACGTSGATCNGTIYSTNAGTSLTQTSNNYGIQVTCGSGSMGQNVEIRNLKIYNIYQKVSNANGDGANTFDVYTSGACNNLSIHDSQLEDARGGISYNFDGQTSSGVMLYNNYIEHHAWGIQYGAGLNGSNSTASIYNNEITNWNDWADTTGYFHTDGIIAYANGSVGGGSSLNLSIYNNYEHGDLAGGVGNIAPVTAFTYCTTDALCTFFNNIVVSTVANDVEGLVLFGSQAKAGQQVYNNTISGPAGDTTEPCVGTGVSSVTIAFNDNICLSAGYAYGEIDNSYAAFTGNNNVFYQVNKIAMDNSGSGPPNFLPTLAQWQSARSQDMASQTLNPQLDSNYVPQATGVQLGANLGVLLGLPPAGSNCGTTGIQCLVYDMSGNPRSPSSTWISGALNFTNTAAPAPPTGLTASVQ